MCICNSICNNHIAIFPIEKKIKVERMNKCLQCGTWYKPALYFTDKKEINPHYCERCLGEKK